MADKLNAGAHFPHLTLTVGESSIDLPFPVAHDVSRQQGDTIGAWWDEKRDFIQPSEFILNHKGRVMHSTYSSSPVGRTDPQ